MTTGCGPSPIPIFSSWTGSVTSPSSDPFAAFSFQLVSRRYERGSIILTSNSSYGEWGTVVGNDVLAAVIVDRFLRYRTIIAIRDRSCRLKENGRARAFRLPKA